MTDSGKVAGPAAKLKRRSLVAIEAGGERTAVQEMERLGILKGERGIMTDLRGLGLKEGRRRTCWVPAAVTVAAVVAAMALVGVEDRREREEEEESNRGSTQTEKCIVLLVYI